MNQVEPLTRSDLRQTTTPLNPFRVLLETIALLSGLTAVCFLVMLASVLLGTAP